MEGVTNNEQVVFKYVLDNPIYYKFVEKSFFTNKSLSALILIAKRFYDKYKEVPSESQMLALLHDNDKIDIEDGFISAVYSIDTESYDQQWLKHTTECWIKWKTLNKQLYEGITIAKTSEVNIDNVDVVVQKIVDTIDASNEVNFNFNEGLDFFDPTSHYQDNSKKIPSGYKYIDTLLGGYDEKTLVCYVGQSNIGKCVSGDSKIKLHNKKTNEFIEMQINDFFEMIKTQEKWQSE